MNYRHAFHAGNFADVHKHAVMALVIRHLCAKPTPFRIIDTHAGAGLYDLTAPEAERTGEWRQGIGRIFNHPLDAPAADLLAPYIEAVARANGPGELRVYPGSPLIGLALQRPQDRLIACEAEPGAAAGLAASLAHETRAKAIAIDGWTALTAYIPPRERRGLVLVDPPYEQPDEFARLADGLKRAHRKWPTGIYLGWYPIKDRSGPDLLSGRLAASRIGKILRSELALPPTGEAGRLGGSGLVVINPPWRLAEELSILMPALAAALGGGAGASRLEWLSGEI